MTFLDDKISQTIDIILPAYNPHAKWEQQVYDNINRLKKNNPQYIFKLYIITDGSQIGYGKDVLQYFDEKLPGTKIIHYKKNKGKGYALRYAVERCLDEWIIYIDYDFPYTDASIKNVLIALEDGADVVVATRKPSYQENLPFFRKRLSHISHIVNKYLLHLTICDTQGGMKGFNKRGRTIFLSTKIQTFLFDTEFVYKAFKRKCNIVAVNAEIKEDVKISAMGMKVLCREFLNLWEVFR